MHRTSRITGFRRATAAVIAAGALSVSSLAAVAPESFSARVVNFEEPMGRAPGLLQVQVTRWATDAERDALTAALMKSGQQGVLEMLDTMPRAGVIRTPGSVGYPFKYARRSVDPNGGERLLVVIDRPIGLHEIRGSWLTRTYPFTIVQMTIDANGEGTGQLMAATKISGSSATGDIAFEQFNATPALLQNVRRE